MNGFLRSALIAGAIAFVAYTVISVATGQSFGAAVGVGVLFFVGTAVITFLIETLISRSKANSRR